MNSKKSFKSESTAGRTVSRKYSNRTADIQADVLVPLSQAGIGAAILAVIVFLWSRDPMIAASAGLLALLAVWIFLLADHRRALWVVEKVTGFDFDGDGYTGEPTKVQVEFTRKGAGEKGMDFVDLPVSFDELHQIAQLTLVHGVTFSRNGLSPVLSQPRYNELAKIMEQRGLLIMLPNNRRVLTEKGAIALEKILYPDGAPNPSAPED